MDYSRGMAKKTKVLIIVILYTSQIEYMYVKVIIPLLEVPKFLFPDSLSLLDLVVHYEARVLVKDGVAPLR